MNNGEFRKVLDSIVNNIYTTLDSKSNEYSSNTDRLENFKEAGLFLNAFPERALLGFVTKHIIALRDFVQTYKFFEVTDAQWDEKIGDIINYMILLKALLVERKNNEQSKQSD